MSNLLCVKFSHTTYFAHNMYRYYTQDSHNHNEFEFSYKFYYNASKKQHIDNKCHGCTKRNNNNPLFKKKNPYPSQYSLSCWYAISWPSSEHISVVKSTLTSGLRCLESYPPRIPKINYDAQVEYLQSPFSLFIKFLVRNETHYIKFTISSENAFTRQF